jgi:hypothetical protein
MTKDSLRVVELEFATPPPRPGGKVPYGPGSPNVFQGAAISDQHVFSRPFGVSDTIKAFDLYVGDAASSPTNVGYAWATPSVDNFFYDTVQLRGDFFASEISISDNGYFISAGEGGDSSLGSAGAGGLLGGRLVTMTDENGDSIALGSLNITLPGEPAFEATVRLAGGDGGNGQINGGHGGTVGGVSVLYPADTTLFRGIINVIGGDGGDGFTGRGGNGGNLSKLNIDSGQVFAGGNAGSGVIGGHGGAVIGNKVAGETDNRGNSTTTEIAVLGGNGGRGLKLGGNGGVVDSFISEFLPVIGSVGGFLHYQGGDGGMAVSGAGGHGGSVLSGSPFAAVNWLAGDIFLGGGDGARGLTGGIGGSVTKFSHAPTIPQTSTVTSIIAGKGGVGTFGAGGAGGGVSGIAVTSKGAGLEREFDFSQSDAIREISDGLINIIPLAFNRIIGGEGGESFGAAGGAGGGIGTIDVSASNADAAFAVAAGKGGDGLNAGGFGGSVVGARVNAGATSGKVLVVAGEGGAAFSAKPLTQDAEGIAAARGAVDGPGGHGGSIIDFIQPTSTATNVDLIGGNGGDTPNHDLAVDNSGRGGSVLGATIAGNIGNANLSTAIKAYNDISNGETLQDFINTVILGAPFVPLTDAVGNVGLVAGAAGRVKDSDINGKLDPASGGVNGRVDSVSARNILSMIAGSVDRVDLIERLTNYRVTIGGGVVGADKDTPPGSSGSVDYLDQDGNLTNTPLPGGGSLLDGAIVAKNIRAILSARDFQGFMP